MEFKPLANPFTSLSQIDTETDDGKRLMAAISIIRNLKPEKSKEEILRWVNDVAVKIFKLP